MGRELQHTIHQDISANTDYLAKEKHQPIAIFIGIIVFLALMIALYFFTKWRFAKIVDEKVSKKSKSVDGTSANPALKSALSGMDGLQMALLAGSGAIAIGCAYAYMLAKKRSDLETGFGLHARLAAKTQDPAHSSYGTQHSSLAGIQ
jgi:ABC-type Fe3+ transport system permease subunit